MRSLQNHIHVIVKNVLLVDSKWQIADKLDTSDAPFPEVQWDMVMLLKHHLKESGVPK